VCAPEERRVVRALFGSLGRRGYHPWPLSVGADEWSEATDVPEVNIEHHFLDKLKGRVRVAKEIDTLQHRDNKAKHDKKWMRATAEALDIELDSDYQSEYVPISHWLHRFVDWSRSATTGLPETSDWSKQTRQN
jgi:ATP-dependent RNA helicase DDX24/MAK5